MSSSSNHALSISHDGHHWQAIDANHNMITLSVADDEMLPTLPDGAVVDSLLLPIEQLLNRTFSLPLSNPKFIDQDILAQEIEEHSSEESESWWLSWRAGQSDDGVSGMMIGVPELLRQHIDANDAWRDAKTISSDIWVRLHHQLDITPEARYALNIDEPNEPNQTNQTNQTNLTNLTNLTKIAVFDTDSTGLFFGVWQCATEHSKQGYWLAMRRLNWSEESEPSSGLIEDIQRSLHSMGWQDDAIAIGSLDSSLHAALNLSAWHGKLCETDELPSRRDATIAISVTSSLNFRHGRWSSGSHMGQVKPWCRTFALAAALMLAWSASMMWQNHQLEQQVLTHQQRVIDAFHKGLPHEKVMIDALAQLQKAAGHGTNNRNDSNNSRNLASQWLQHIEAINRVYQKTTWTVKEITFKNGSMTISGQTKDLQTMNKLQQALQTETGKDVKILDTDLSDQQVKFKLVWS